MTVQEAACYLNQRVRLHDPVHRIGGEYIFSGVMLRKNPTGLFMQAELLDIRNGNSVMMVALDNIEPLHTECSSTGGAENGTESN